MCVKRKLNSNTPNEIKDESVTKKSSTADSKTGETSSKTQSNIAVVTNGLILRGLRDNASQNSSFQRIYLCKIMN